MGLAVGLGVVGPVVLTGRLVGSVVIGLSVVGLAVVGLGVVLL